MRVFITKWWSVFVFFLPVKFGEHVGWWNTLLTLFGLKVSGWGHLLASDQKGKPLSVTFWGAQTLKFNSQQDKLSQQFYCTLQKERGCSPARVLLLSAEWRQHNLYVLIKEQRGRGPLMSPKGQFAVKRASPTCWWLFSQQGSQKPSTTFPFSELGYIKEPTVNTQNTAKSQNTPQLVWVVSTNWEKKSCLIFFFFPDSLLKLESFFRPHQTVSL